MIAETSSKCQSPAWQIALKSLTTTPEALRNTLNLPKSSETEAKPGHQLFAIRAPKSYLDRIELGQLNDPLLKQILPTEAEQATIPGYSNDPLNETTYTQKTGLIQKYPGRALIILATSCAINCRYCFRRTFPYADHRISQADWENLICTLASDQSITEVILSGGDPLMLPDEVLGKKVRALSSIKHIKRLRIHTRLPIVIPERIDHQLIQWIKATPLNTVMVLHANHANEINAEVKNHLAKLKSANVTLLNQSVLLKGVNDSVEALSDLSEALFNAGVLPYYIHLLDKVNGTAHFDMDELKAIHLMKALANRLPGYLVPKLVREIPGKQAKTVIGLNDNPITKT